MMTLEKYEEPLRLSRYQKVIDSMKITPRFVAFSAFYYFL